MITNAPNIDHHTTALARFDPNAFIQRLIQRAQITAQDAQLATGVAQQRDQPILAALLDLGVIAEEALANAIATDTNAPRWAADHEDTATAPQPEDLATDILPIDFMRTSRILIFRLPDTTPFTNTNPNPNTNPNHNADNPPQPDIDPTHRHASPKAALQLVLADPSDAPAWHATLARTHATRLPFTAAVATQKQITDFLDQHDAEHHDTDNEPDAISHADIAGELASLRDMASEAPVIRMFNQIVEHAMELEASDIHLERFDNRTSIRYRVDGMLIDQPSPPKETYEALIVRMKIMAGLDIAERRKAQDGRIRQRLRGRAVDLRVSIIPTQFGQDAALRIQDRQKLAEIDLQQLGFDDQSIKQLNDAAAKSHGILLITGPTGSGKTTTLYAMLRRLKSKDRKIITVEDPIEYTMDGINQMQANPAINMGFANALRHILRHDPDVILIGEIRDHETAEMAFQSALTGHMVLSTLHTNDVPSTFVRLIDMGVEPYLVNAAVEGVSAQRLLRRLCNNCHNRNPDRETCRRCGGLGYRGRVAAMEFSTLPPAVKQLLIEHADETRLRRALNDAGFRPLAADARRLAALAMTDAAEIARVLGPAALHPHHDHEPNPSHPEPKTIDLNETGIYTPKHRAHQNKQHHTRHTQPDPTTQQGEAT